MTVAELREALADLDGGFEIKVSGDSFVFGDGLECRDTQEGPGLQNVTQQDGYVVLWPDCSWGEAMEHADAKGLGVE